MSASAAPVLPEHEHTLRLLEVSYDDAGTAVREFTCTTCGAVWFE